MPRAPLRARGAAFPPVSTMSAFHTNGLTARSQHVDPDRRPSPAAAKPGALLPATHLFFPLLAVVAVLVLAPVAVLLFARGQLPIAQLLTVEIALTLLGLVSVSMCAYRVQHHLLMPLARLRQWAMRMRRGDLSARVPVPFEGELAPLATDLSCLCEEFKGLKANLDKQVAKQTERLAQKNASLKILYDVAARINEAQSEEELLLRFLRALKEMVGARAATVRVASADGLLRLIGSIGQDDRLIAGAELLPVPLCPCGAPLVRGTLLCSGAGQDCVGITGHGMIDRRSVENIHVPLKHRGRTLGCYDLYACRPAISGREDFLELLTSIGSHLGMALEKARLDQESKHISIMEERAAIANELHDSLAQTLASLRFQIQVLADVLEGEGSAEANRRVAQAGTSLEEAHTELRELIKQFRAPLGEGDLVAAIEKLVERFRRDSGIAVFVQQDFRVKALPAETQHQVLRIVQECLANVRKHSAAQLVRVLLRGNPAGECMVLVEDNGMGFTPGTMSPRAGEHIGLSVMEERAAKIGGELRIESEPGEGTRVELTFDCRSAGKAEASPAGRARGCASC